MHIASPLETIHFENLSRNEIQKLLQVYQLNLSVDEALKIQNVFLKRPPTLAECVLWSIQSSEHCSYKSSRLHLKKLITESPDVISGAKEDAGIIAVATDKTGVRYGVVISHESHNHPSQILPYEGAATGVGGNVRDVSCMGADVIAIANGLRFGNIYELSTKEIQQGVVAGIAGYGNPIGVPNIAGDVYYDPAYRHHCLVTIVTLGIVCEPDVIHSYTPNPNCLKPGDHDFSFILIGNATDHHGFGGASFASTEMDHKKSNQGAIQEPNAFLKKHLLKANEALFRKLKLLNQLHRVGFKDLGAGGLACASIELADASGLGAQIELERVNIAKDSLHPIITLCSETQERMLWVVAPDLVDMILNHYNEVFALPQVSPQATARVIGKTRNDGQYIVTQDGQSIVNVYARDITQGIVYNRPLKISPTAGQEPLLPEPHDYHDLFLTILAHENIASRAPLFEQYDKQVQGRTLIEAGEADAGVLQPFNNDIYPEEIRNTGIALSLDHNPRYCQIDAYWGAVNAVVESARNVAVVGASPIAITDCLCFGNPEKPEQMGYFSESIRGIVDACKAIGLANDATHSLPVIAGNVSFYNQSELGVIPPSPLISCLGKIDDIHHVITKDLQQQDSILLLIGERLDECGGSIYYAIHEELGISLPKPNLQQIGNEIRALTKAIEKNLILAAHDISEGGLAVAVAEMTFKYEIGVDIQIPGTLSTVKKLFSETPGFILEVSPKHLASVQELFAHDQIHCSILGKTQKSPRLQLEGVIDILISTAKCGFENGLREKLDRWK